MITVRRANTLGVSHSGTVLLTSHFSFADYKCNSLPNTGCLHAVNLGALEAGQTYSLKTESATDILTWVCSGSLTTTISGFGTEFIEKGGLHLISTGTGCSSLNWTSGATGVSFIQFWFLADILGTEPAQEARPALPELEDGSFKILASGFPEDDPEDEMFGSEAPVPLTASARLLHASLPKGEGAAYNTTPDRSLYLIVLSGIIRIENETLYAGDACLLTDIETLTVLSENDSTILLTDNAKI